MDSGKFLAVTVFRGVVTEVKKCDSYESALNYHLSSAKGVGIPENTSLVAVNLSADYCFQVFEDTGKGFYKEVC